MENETKIEENLSTTAVEEKVESEETINPVTPEKNKLSIPVAIIIVGVLIAGAIYLSSFKSSNSGTTGIPVVTATLSPVKAEDRTLGNKNAKVTLVIYEDFQCVFCGAVSGLQPDSSPAVQYLKKQVPSWTPFMPEVINNYVKNGNVLLVYRDYPFLGADAKAKGLDKEDESIESAIAARCAEDQGKFWEYYNYLFTHQSGENQGAFSTTNLKSFAKNLNLDTTSFNKCLDDNKYAQAIADSKIEGDNAGVTGTPKGFILRDGKIVSTIEGAESLQTVKQKIDAALK